MRKTGAAACARTARACALRLASLTIAVCAVAALGGCATKPAAARGPEPRVQLTSAPIRLVDRSHAVLCLEARIDNPRDEELRLITAECVLVTEGSLSKAGSLRPLEPLPLSIPARGSSSVSFTASIDLGSLDATVIGPKGPAEAQWSAAAAFRLRSVSGGEFEELAAATGTVPIIREPEISIRSLRILRDVLVTTRLALGIEIRNPNAFPIDLASLSYDFYGESKKWAKGAEGQAIRVAARDRREYELEFEMNFADVDRRLFDLVAKLGTVDYRLSGSAAVSTGLEVLPSFSLGFNLEGSCLVER
jgi:LEA14-like dessication related protein